jgi:hypothetical protein
MDNHNKHESLYEVVVIKADEKQSHFQKQTSVGLLVIAGISHQ